VVLVAFVVLVACRAAATTPPAEVASGRTTTVDPLAGSADVARVVDPVVRSFTGEAGIWIGLPGESAPLYEANAGTPRIAASLYKLAVMLEVERLVEARAWSYADPVEIREEDVTVDGSNELPGAVLSVDDALEQTIVYSDNGAALALLRMVGAERVNATLGAAAMADFHVALDANDDHTVTPRALGTFFSLLSRGRLISAAASERMLDRLRRQTISDRLPARLPQGTTVAHKTGDLVGWTHDAGIITTPTGPVVVVCLTEGADPDAARAFIAEIAAIAYTVFR
jgi:beta-lactamase class A